MGGGGWGSSWHTGFFFRAAHYSALFDTYRRIASKQAGEREGRRDFSEVLERRTGILETW